MDLKSRPDFLKRFWQKVTKTDSCWLWNASKNTNGYGTINVYGKTMLSHRASWLVEHGCLPAGLHVLHKCDVPACVNPEHLFLGTDLDNTRDMISKGRKVVSNGSGETSHNRKLSWDDVRDIRRRLKDGATRSELAIEYRITQNNIYRIVHNQIWKEA